MANKGIEFISIHKICWKKSLSFIIFLFGYDGIDKVFAHVEAMGNAKSILFDGKVTNSHLCSEKHLTGSFIFGHRVQKAPPRFMLAIIPPVVISTVSWELFPIHINVSPQHFARPHPHQHAPCYMPNSPCPSPYPMAVICESPWVSKLLQGFPPQPP